MSDGSVSDGALPVPQYYYTDEELAESHAAAMAAASGLLQLQGGAPAPGSGKIQPARPATRALPARPATPLPPAWRGSVSPSPSPQAPEDASQQEALLSAASTAAEDQYLIQVKMNYKEQGRGPPNWGSKVVTKNASISKMVNAPLRNISRAKFVATILEAHGLADHSSSGGQESPKATRARLSNFEVALEAILKKRGCSSVSVEFAMEDLNGFSIRTKRPFLTDSGVENEVEDEELLHGTTVPRVDTFTNKAQLHGGYIIQLKKAPQGSAISQQAGMQTLMSVSTTGASSHGLQHG
ncbi:hypothetical protein C8Q76DRAFT_688632 [Earliella scabrosa]|nr:hypothetical protein C8Q76DRAFT_688632 [Earliella scabrosa]